MNQSFERDLYERQLPRSVEESLAALEAAAEDWGAGWEPHSSGGLLRLPVLHGLHRGLLEGPISVEKNAFAAGSIVRFRVEGSQSRVNWTACLVLALGAGGGVIAMAWPFFPELLRLAPVGIALAIAAWLLVASRLRTADVDDFLELVAEMDLDVDAE